jgi:uncharacterized membrane protein YdjX (TVP38/TMEM64 family)
LVGFIFLFGIFVGGLSVILNKFLEPQIEPITRVVSHHPLRVLAGYFLFVMTASVLVPIPTLPVDLLLFDQIDPVSVMIVRILGGVAGGSISYYLAYNYGWPIIKRWLSRKNYEFVNSLSGLLSWRQFFIIAMIPVINAELMAFVGGVSKIGYRKTIWALLPAIGYRVLFIYALVRVR